jgi:hypothetical protein
MDARFETMSASQRTVTARLAAVDAVVAAFEEGALASLGKQRRSAAASAEALARIIAKHVS